MTINTKPTELSALLAANYMSVRVTIARWQARKSDRELAAELDSMKGASRGSSNASKNLLHGADAELQQVRSAFGSLREYVRKFTLPYGDADGRGNANLLPAAKAIEFFQGFTALQNQAKADLNTFLSVYPTRMQQAITALGGMADPSDYPTVDEVRAKFASTLKVDPLPQNADFSRVSIPANVAELLASRRAKQSEEYVETAMAELYKRAITQLESIAKQTTKLAAGERAVLGAGLYENLDLIADMLVTHNLTSDNQLQSISDKIKELVAIDAETMRATTQAAATANGLALSCLAAVCHKAGVPVPDVGSAAPAPAPAPEPAPEAAPTGLEGLFDDSDDPTPEPQAAPSRHAEPEPDPAPALEPAMTEAEEIGEESDGFEDFDEFDEFEEEEEEEMVTEMVIPDPAPEGTADGRSAASTQLPVSTGADDQLEEELDDSFFF